jgi:hypothetical protein
MYCTTLSPQGYEMDFIEGVFGQDKKMCVNR